MTAEEAAMLAAVFAEDVELPARPAVGATFTREDGLRQWAYKGKPLYWKSDGPSERVGMLLSPRRTTPSGD